VNHPSRIVPLVLLGFVALGSLARAQGDLLPTWPRLSPQDAIRHGIASGRLPPWLTWDDDVRLVWGGARVYGCFTDDDTGARWVSWGPRKTISDVLAGYPYQFSPGVLTTAADYRVCWP